MKPGIAITQTNPETVFNTLLLTLASPQQGGQVRIFLAGRGIKIDNIEDPAFDLNTEACED